MARFLTLILAALALGAHAANHDRVVSPVAPGRFAVACSNLEQDTSKIAPGALATDYWEGNQVQGRDTYVTDILARPDAVVRFDAPVPGVRRLYPGHAGETVPFVALVCYPTSRANPDANYSLPGGGTIPRMQRAGEAPRTISWQEYYDTLGITFIGPGAAPTGTAKLPLLVFSHGLGGSPIGPGYIDVVVQLAAQGYMVAGVFHADARFSRLRVEDLSDFTYLVLNFSRVVEMELMRPLALKYLTDTLLAAPGFAAAIDPERIGGFGASLGGQAMVNLLGGRITSSIDLACDDSVRDPRIKAAVGYVPYAGQTFLPAFCAGQSGADGVNRPFLAISGTADTTAPSRVMEQALNRFGSSRYFVELIGGQHELRPEDAGDVLTWTLTFLNAYLQVPSDPGAMGRFIKMAQVAGGREDNLLVDVHVPLQLASGEAQALEFHNTRLDHYFVAAGQDEIANILAGGAGPGWELTGQAFKVFPQMPSDTLTTVAPVCRFYGPGPNSHFFTVSASECALVKRDRGWLYEGIGYYIQPVGSDGRCTTGFFEVNRAYNNGFVRNDSNHRFSTSDSTMREMQRKGWTVEGTVMCARP